MVNIQAAIHPHTSGIITISVPGITGTPDGWENKYGKLADIVQAKGSAVVRMDNEYAGEPYPGTMLNNFDHVMNYAFRNAKEICGSENPTIYLMGWSAGASTIAAEAHTFGEVEKILLMAPSGDAGMQPVTEGLEKFSGEVYIAIGEHDEIVGSSAGQTFYDLSIGASKRELITIPDCGHQFIGETNGKIMSKAPLWAFFGDTTFPNPEGGHKLYD